VESDEIQMVWKKKMGNTEVICKMCEVLRKDCVCRATAQATTFMTVEIERDSHA
jgi:hypothetical protein